jgi:hypothetical protein
MLVRRITVSLKRLPAVAVCALATHALVYRTFWPADGLHGYFGWYEPVVALASLVSLAGLGGFVALAYAARRSGRPLGWVAAVDSPAPTAPMVRSLVTSSLAFLLIQESVERSVQAGHPVFQLFTPFEWLLLLAGLAATSSLMAVGLRLARMVVGRVLGSPPPPRRSQRRLGLRWSLVTCNRRRPRPLAGRFALRAPPLLS